MRGQQDEPESEYAAGSVADRSTAAAEWGRTQAALVPACRAEVKVLILWCK